MIYLVLLQSVLLFLVFIFFFNDTATTEIYTLSLHDALPISVVDAPALQAGDQRGQRLRLASAGGGAGRRRGGRHRLGGGRGLDRKSTRLNSSHANISYAVFCLKKKKKKN